MCDMKLDYAIAGDRFIVIALITLKRHKAISSIERTSEMRKQCACLCVKVNALLSVKVYKNEHKNNNNDVNTQTSQKKYFITNTLWRRTINANDHDHLNKIRIIHSHITGCACLRWYESLWCVMGARLPRLQKKQTVSSLNFISIRRFDGFFDAVVVVSATTSIRLWAQQTNSSNRNHVAVVRPKGICYYRWKTATQCTNDRWKILCVSEWMSLSRL